MKAYDAVVAGAGVIGAATAYYLARRGLAVALLDRTRPPTGATASGASAGGVRQQNREPDELRLALHSIRLWANLEAELGADLRYRHDGMTICLDDPSLLPALRRRVQRERDLGLDVWIVEEPQLHEMLPLLSPGIVAGSYCPSDGHADPILTTDAFTAAAVRQGADVYWNSPLTAIETREGRVAQAHTPEKAIPCQHVVLAAGHWSAPVAHELGVDLPLRPGYLQMMATAPTAPVLRQVLGWVGHGISLKQVPSGGFVIGGGWPGQGDPERYQANVLPESMAKSADVVVHLVPSLAGIPVVRAWVGIESHSRDGLPVIGGLGGVDGLLIAAGFSGHGFALAPAVGELLAERIATGVVPELLRPFSPDRFAGRAA